mgnify:FL=1|tara:strand:- start:159 stop:518 length:360 start_codon:yes stop_codon:yes gene_type:complete
MKLEDIKDVKVRRYVRGLQLKLEEFEANTTKVKSFLALKNFITQNNKLLTNYRVSDSADELSDKEDKALERGLKFSEKLDYLQTLLDKMYGEIGEIPEEQGKQKAASAYEQVMRDLKNG